MSHKKILRNEFWVYPYWNLRFKILKLYLSELGKKHFTLNRITIYVYNICICSCCMLSTSAIYLIMLSVISECRTLFCFFCVDHKHNYIYQLVFKFFFQLSIFNICFFILATWHISRLVKQSGKNRIKSDTIP